MPDHRNSIERLPRIGRFGQGESRGQARDPVVGKDLTTAVSSTGRRQTRLTHGRRSRHDRPNRLDFSLLVSGPDPRMEMRTVRDAARESADAPFVTRDRDGPWYMGDETKRAGARRNTDPKRS